MLQAQWQWRSTREGQASEGRGTGWEREGAYLAHRHEGSQPGIVAMCSAARVGVGEAVVACSSIDFGRPLSLLTTGQPSGNRGRRTGMWLRKTGRGTCAYGGGPFSIASIFLLVELAWYNAGKRTGSSNHEKNHITQVLVKSGVGQSQRQEPR